MPAPAFKLIAFDADDTLWENERYYRRARQRFQALLEKYTLPDDLEAQLEAIEIRNLPVYGYGVSGFTFSLIEAAIGLTQGRVSSSEIQTLIDLAKEMLTAKVELFAQAEETIAKLSGKYPLMLITKGDLHHQLSKVDKSGLKHYFRYVEVVQDKTSQTYAEILGKHQLAAGHFLMVGNSLRSDILPVIALGGRAIYIPNPLTWSHEQAIPSELARQGYFEAENLGQVPILIEQLNGNGSED